MGRKGFSDKVTLKVNLERSEYDALVKVAPNGNLSNFVREIIKGYVGQPVSGEAERPKMILKPLARAPIVQHDLRCPCDICRKARGEK